jgi:dTDP-4-amino-4,6-dideoxygalactose transaminase
MIKVGCPYFSDSDISEITSRIASVLRSGWLTSGEVVEEFEKKFSSFVGTKYAVALNSGTAALHAILSALKLSSNDEVVVPANTFISTAFAVLYVGAKPVLADCDINTFNVTAETIERSLSSKTKAVIVTHVGGNPCEMDEIVKLCQEKGLTLIEDAAHAHGSKYREKSCGAFGLANAFSFYPTKVMTSGEGGMVTTDSKEIYEYIKTFRNVGRAEIGHGPIVMLGYNYRMSNIHAVIGLNQLRHLEEFVKKRNELAKIYNQELEKIEWIEPQKVYSHSISSYYAYIVKILPNSPVSRDALMKYLREKGIETTIMFRPVHVQPYFKSRFNVKNRYPNAELVGTNSLVLPLHVGMTTEDVDYVVSALKSVKI